MSAAHQLPIHLVQAPVPSSLAEFPSEAPWTDEQPSLSARKPPRAAGLYEPAYWQRVTEAAVPSIRLRELKSAYVIEDDAAVAAFIDQNRLHGVLLQASIYLRDAFGEVPVKTISLLRDDEGFETLLCLISFPGAMQEARRALRSFDELWWLEHARHAGGKLNFDFDLI